MTDAEIDKAVAAYNLDCIPVWKQIIVQAREANRLGSMIPTDEEMASVLERFDQTDTALQRKIVFAFAAKCNSLAAENELLLELVRGIVSQWNDAQGSGLNGAVDRFNKFCELLKEADSLTSCESGANP